MQGKIDIRRWEAEEKQGETWTEEKEYIATHASTYQLISSKFLSSLKHRPKVDCGRQEANKTVRNSGKEPDLKRTTSYSSHYTREADINTEPLEALGRARDEETLKWRRTLL